MLTRGIQSNISAALLTLLLAIPSSSDARLQQGAGAPAGPADLPEIHLGKGYEALKQDRYDVAISEFRAALKLDHTLVLRAQFPLAVALFESHQPEEARRE